MDGEFYREILQRNLVPFIREHFPQHHRFWQDNDPKHTARLTQEFYTENGINWWKTPAQSPVLTLLHSNVNTG